MASITIHNIDDLRSEISRLEIAKDEQTAAIKKHFSSPSAIFGTVVSLFGGPSSIGAMKQDFLTMISRFVLPLVLNKTLFSGSNFLVKGLVGLVSQKAAGFISEDAVTGLWDKAKGLISKIGIGKKKSTEPDPRIPPLSETY
ncbi:MAG: hypothetical protein EOP47_21645 [Sphingobacteriaceae bacterium]|nr:MAG: hypothetical protein EOP47_21645 [Sphingobacteriaceae bacterium]